MLIYPIGVVLTGKLMSRLLYRRKSISAMAEREELFRNLFENNHAVMLIVDPDGGVVVDANPAAVTFYGWPRDTLKRMKMSDINLLSPSEVQVQAAMELARKEERKYFIFQHALADGSICDVEVFSGPIVVEGRSLLYSIIHDITERRLLEEKNERLIRIFADSLNEIYLFDIDNFRIFSS